MWLAWILSWAVLLIFGTFLILWLICWQSGCFENTKDIYSYNERPNICCLMLKGFILSVRRKQGVLYPRESGEARPSMPQYKDDTSRITEETDAQITFKDCRINHERLKKYKNVCGDVDSSVVPLCYLESLFTRSLMTLAVSSKCALTPLGLIHMRQTITIHEKLDDLLASPFDLHTALKRYRKVDRGIEADIQLQVFNKEDRCVWEGEVTVLSRNAKSQRSGAHRATGTTKESSEDINGEIELTVPGNTGIQYAQAAGDWNPHHLYSWSARLLGYKQPIAHGMWTLARALSVLQESGLTLSLPVHIDASFKRPLFMPGVCLVQHGTTSSSRWIRVVDKITGVPHLLATICSGDR